MAVEHIAVEDADGRRVGITIQPSADGDWLATFWLPLVLADGTPYEGPLGHKAGSDRDDLRSAAVSAAEAFLGLPGWRLA